MKLNLDLLQKFIDLPMQDLHEIRVLLDESGLEVDDIVEEAGQTILNIETLAQRGDHLSAQGVARELSAKLLVNLKQPKLSELPSDQPAKIQLIVKTDKCYSYGLLDIQFSTGFSLDSQVSKYLLNVPEDRPALVSYLNYVQMELGQPMHAFDYNKVEGEIKVILSDCEQEIVALDGKTYKVPADSLLITDRKKVIAVAGVIGCANSMVDQNTTRALVESACFDPILVRKTARRMGLSTDASYVFERGADPEGYVSGLRRLLFLLENASSVDESWVHALGYSYHHSNLLTPKTIKFDLEMLRQQIAAPRLKALEITSRLKHLGFAVQSDDKDRNISVVVPSWRYWNCENQSVILEDFARSHGLNAIKLELPIAEVDRPQLSAMQKFIAAVEPVLVGSGLSEVVTRSYYSAQQVQWLEALNPGISDRHVQIANAIDSGYSHLRISNIIHHAQLAERSFRQGVSSVKIYELNRVFSKQKFEDASYEHETNVLALAISGRWYDNSWKREPETSELVAHTKGLVDTLCAALGLKIELHSAEYAFFHPSCQAEVFVDQKCIGRFGLLHPLLKDHLALTNEVVFAELYVDSILSLKASKSSAEINNYPAIKRDLTLKLPKKFFASEVCRNLEKLQIQDLIEIAISDDFQKSGEGFRRTTFKLVFQALDTTLQGSEVDQRMQKIISLLSSKFDLELAN
jgi:phenylalanyl-tRNA synthetase beta chain